jgi:alpha-L-arabinofuranosidase
VGGDDRFYNNILAGANGLAPYDGAKLPVRMDGNVFLQGAKPSKHEPDPFVKQEFDPAPKLVEKADGFYLELTLDQALAAQRARPLVTSELLGQAAIPNLPYERPDGTPLRVDTDYFGKPRTATNPTAGPFQNPGTGRLTWKVWPR